MQSVLKQLHEYIKKGASVSTDSRQKQDGAVFFALRGENFDANDFALNALANGAAVAVVDKPELPDSAGLLKVPDVLDTLQRLAAFHRTLFDIPVIAITGTNGKTTTKELVNAVVSQKFQTLCTPGNYNNHIGLPLTLLQLRKEHQVAIIEMGANHVGEIALLCQLAKPTAGLITNIGKAHLEGFGSVEGIVKAKTELFKFLDQNGGTVFLNADQPLLRPHAKHRNVTYGKDVNCQFRGKVEATDPFLKVVCDFNTETHTMPKHSLTLHTQLIGDYNLENVLAACAVGATLGVEPGHIKTGIEKYFPQNNRSQLVDSGKNTILMDAYNANPTSMQAAIRNFNSLGFQKKALILGDMLEMGKEAAHEHRQLVKYIQQGTYDIVILVGEEFSKVTHNTLQNGLVFADRFQARQWLKQNPLHGYSILVKGSRGIRLEELTDLL